MRHSQSAVHSASISRLDAMKPSLRGAFKDAPEWPSGPLRADELARSDRQIRRDVIDELQSEPTISASSVSVRVDHGNVTLTGRADGAGEKWLIESAARRIAGVKEVTGALEIIVSEPGTRTDNDILQDCEHALGLTVQGANHAIAVMVSSGWVTLSGNVAWGYERWAAEEIVGSLMGVMGVNGQIKVRPLVSQEDVSANVKAALYPSPAGQAPEIDIEVNRDRVILQGFVHSLMQRRAATNAARSTPGVKSVIDRTVLV